MLNITKQGNSIKVVGVNNPTYPFNGTLTYPLNSIILVVDSSNMATFRSAANNDVLFTGIITDITINGTPQTKETIGQQFGAISNASTGGGGTGGAVDSVNGQTGTVVLTANDVNAYSKTESDGKYQAKLTAGTGIEITGENVINVTLDTNIYQVVESLPESEINPNKIYLVLSAESGETNLYTEYLYVNSKWEKIGEYKADVDLTPYLKSSEAASTYATKQELAGETSEREKQDSALGGMIAGETEAREQAITNLTATVQGKLDTATYNSEKATFETKENAAATYQPKGDYASETLVNNLEGMVTDLQDWYGRLNDETRRLDDAKQDKLVSGTNIKTINSQSLLGEGNIEITVQGGGITDAPNDGKLYGRKSEQWTEVVIPDTSNLATKAELGAKLDTATYNEEKATFALKTEIPNTENLATKTELTEGLAGKANTSDLSNYLTTSNAQSTYATKSELGAKLDVETYNSEKATFALKSELPDTSDFITTETAAATYQPKGEYLTAVPDNYVTDEELNGKGYATTEQLNAKQDTLVSGTNIKTVNGNSLLGSGDITIEGGTGSGVKEWDFAQLQSDNEYRNNFIANAKVSDIINNVSYQSTTYDHCSILCIKGSTYTLLLNITTNPMIAPLTVAENTALISSAINIYTIVDSTLSADSTNPVQNKVIKAELDKKANARKHDLSTYGGAINAGDTLTNVGSYGLLKVFVCVYTDLLNVIAIGLNAEGKDIVINLKNENVEGTWKWNVKSEIEIGGGTSGSGIATWDYTQLQSDQEYRTNFLSHVKVSDDLINLGGSDNPEHASILTIDNNVYTVMYNVGGNPKVTSINIQESGATITNIDAIPKNVATTTENGLMSSADKTKLDSIDVASILSRITALETQMGEVSAKLDAINGEAV